VQNVTRDIVGDGDGEMELTLKHQVMMMAQWSSHWNGTGAVIGAGSLKLMKLNLPPKLVEKKLVWVSVISFCKIFIPSYTFDALLFQNWPFSPPP